MRLINADELKEKLLKIQNDTVNQKVRRGSAKSDAWILAYLLILDEYIKILDEMPSVTCGYDADDIFGAYGRGYSKGREDILKEQQQMEDYCKNDCDTVHSAYRNGYIKGCLIGEKETLKEYQHVEGDINA